MKRILLFTLALFTMVTMYAQHSSQQGMKVDKWYVGATYGLNSKTTNNGFFGNPNASMAVRLGYDMTPVFGYMGEATLFFGDVKFGASKCFVKAINADLLAVVNLSPLLFHPAEGQRSFYEVRLFGGFGINHICGFPIAENNNDFISKFGADLGVNLGRNKQFFVYLQPAINYNLDHYSRTQYNINYSALQISVGANYRFSWSNLFKGVSLKKIFKGKKKNVPAADEPTDEPLVEPVPEPVTVTLPEDVTEEDPDDEFAFHLFKEEQKEPVAEEKADKPAKTEKADKPAKTEKADKPAKTEKADKPAKTEKADKPAKTEKADKPAKTENTQKKGTPAPSKPVTSSPVRQPMKGVTEVATYMKTHPKSTVIIRGNKAQAQEASNQLVRRYGISLARITIEPGTQQQVTFAVQ